jgi:serine/threonine protein kinase
MKVEHVELDIEKAKFLYYLDKGLESSLVMVSYQDQHLVGKLYHKTELEKNSMMQVVRQEIEVSEVLNHPFIPKFYTVIENKQHILKLTEFVQGESLYDTIR